MTNRMRTGFVLTPIAAALLAGFTAQAAAAEAKGKDENQAAQEQTQGQAQGQAQTLPTVQVEEQLEGSYRVDVISSPKFTQALVDTPQTISVITREQLDDQAVFTLSDALRRSPGITFQAGEFGAQTSGDGIFMRGFDTQGSIFLDGIRDLGPAVRDVFNVERIEISKGPSGSDIGRASAGGYVNVTSKTALDDDFVHAMAAYGSADFSRVTADINQTTGKGTAFRLNVAGQDGGVPARDEVTRQLWAVAPAVTFGLGSDTRVELFSQHIRQNNVPDGGVPAIGLPGYRNPVLDGENSTGTVVDARPVASGNFYGFDADYEDIRADQLTLRINHRLGAASSFTNTTRYGHYDQERNVTLPLLAPIVSDPNPEEGQPPVLRQDPSTWEVERIRRADFRVNEILANQAIFNAALNTGPVRHEFAAGGELLHEVQALDNYNTVRFSRGNLPLANLYSPNPADPAVDLTPTGTSDGAVDSVAVFMFDTLKFSEQWLLNLSGRAERYQLVTNTITITPGSSTTVPPGTLVGTRFKDSGTLFSYRTGLTYKPSPEGAVYVAYANSLTPPASDSLALRDPSSTSGFRLINSSATDPQQATSAELGVKWEFADDRVLVTAALFSSERKNDLARQTDGSIRQYGSRTIQGLDTTLVGKLTPNWNLNLGYLYQQAEIAGGTEVVQPDGTVLEPINGLPVEYTPKHNLSLWSTYALNPKLELGGGLRYVGEQSGAAQQRAILFPNPSANGLEKVEAYSVVDLVATYALTPKLDIQLNAYNILDESYAASVNNGGERYFPGDPRSFLASLSITL